jgi:oligoendopeptidase F
MLNLTLPGSPDDFATADWAGIEPYYEALASYSLAGRSVEEVRGWLEQWSRLEDLVDEAEALLLTNHSRDTANEGSKALYLRWVSEVDGQLRTYRDRLAGQLIESGWSEQGMETALSRFRRQIELFRPESQPLLEELSMLNVRYREVVGAMSVEWDGKRLPIPQVEARLTAADRGTRERAFRRHLDPFIEAQAREQLNDIFDKMIELRQQLAHNAGFENYRDYAHAEMGRFDYTPQDCLRWHAAVEEGIGPVVQRILERRRELMGLDRLRPWDVEGLPDLLGRPPLQPFATADELIAGMTRIFASVHSVFGQNWQAMASRGQLDLESRPGKAPGAFCIHLPWRRLPLMLMNAAGVQKDIETASHEGGHAMHYLEDSVLPLTWQRTHGPEVGELASMSMELLAAHHLGAAGFYNEEEVKRARAEQLERILLFFGHCASVDAFQHWIYTDPGGTNRDARDRKWLELRRRFEPGVDFSGLDDYRIARWLKQPHFFLYPFYYIEYGLAQLGALQVWRKSLNDLPGAVTAYRKALALGGSRSLPELYAQAGARLIFDAPGMQGLAALVVEQYMGLVKHHSIGREVRGREVDGKNVTSSTELGL